MITGKYTQMPIETTAAIHYFKYKFIYKCTY